MRIAFALLLLLLASCSNPARSITDGAVEGLMQSKDSLKALTRELTEEATTTATTYLTKNIEASSKNIFGNAHENLRASASRIDSSVDRLYDGADRTVENARRELTSPATLRFLAQARDTALGSPTQGHVRSLIQVAFQEFRRQQDSTLRALEGRTDSWQTTIQNLAAPVLVVLGGLFIVALLVIAILRLVIFIKQRKQQ